MRNSEADIYFTDGCGRCKLGGTPDCKVHTWSKELKVLRQIALECGLTEERKWGVPCYTYQGKNIAILGAFKEKCVLSFFKGSLLSDEKKLLEKPGENSNVTRLFRFTDVKQILQISDDIRSYLFEAIEIEKAGIKVKPVETKNIAIPEEFDKMMKKDKALKKAFQALTPGRQKSWLLHIGSAKQEATRISRIEKAIPEILKGKGWGEDYRKK